MISYFEIALYDRIGSDEEEEALGKSSAPSSAQLISQEEGTSTESNNWSRPYEFHHLFRYCIASEQGTSMER